ncbi:hypothetical protein [Mammaliicoccus lentus]
MKYLWRTKKVKHLNSRGSKKQKVIAINELRSQTNYKLKDILDVAQIARSVYHYWIKKLESKNGVYNKLVNLI